MPSPECKQKILEYQLRKDELELSAQIKKQARIYRKFFFLAGALR